MASPHYSLRWNNHQSHILNAFDTLLQNETLVDVTLVCEETSVRAHKVVLSACSPYFQRIFSENPCKHPVIVLKDLSGWEVQAIVDFMYKGEISVVQEQLSSLIKAAESLQVRGLAHTEHVVSDKPITNQPPCTPPPLSGLFVPPGRNFSSSGIHMDKESSGPSVVSPFSPSPVPHYEPPLKLPQIPHLPHISFGDGLPPHSLGNPCASPQPRRKQVRKARPRRRSGDMSGVQDLSKGSVTASAEPPMNEVAENLSVKKPPQPVQSNSNSNNTPLLPSSPHTPVISPNQPHPPAVKAESEESLLLGSARSDMHTPDRERERERMEYCNSNESMSLPPPPPVRWPLQLVDSALDSPNFPHLPSVSALSLTPPHMFPLDSPLGFFPALDACRNPLLNDLPEQRNENHQILGKRKMGRPKGQHSAPRGGPPRSWTNAELTEALQHVWNKKMTTSQASRIFGIPYNSLLMYVRGKYGKSLKLEQLKKDCLGAPGGPLDLLGLGPLLAPPNNNNNNNNNNANKSNAEDIVGHPPVSEHDLISLAGGFNPYSPASFYHDFPPSFPVPVSMIHLLPQSEKNRDIFAPSLPLPLDISMNKDEDCKGSAGRRSRSNSSVPTDEEPPPPPREDVTRLVEQNGQN